jgi:pyridoxine kinase
LNVLSIQSHVAYGHVGNAAAVFPMQRLGVEVWPVHTVQFSNHTGYGAWRGPVFEADMIRAVVQGIGERGVLPTCDAVLSGYMGSAEIGAAVLEAVAAVRAANPAALYCCDPVIGDVEEGVYVRPGIEAFLRARAVPEADILTPNQFELGRLTGLPNRTVAEAGAAVAALQARGPRVVLVTSALCADTPADRIDLLAGAEGQLFRVRTPRLAIAVNGAGDCIAALFLVHYARTGSAAAALEAAAASVYGLLKRTAAAGSREILTVAAQEEYVTPGETFAAEAV